ncbi:MAG: hypothetical protein PHX68_02545 [Alphaproteobacteria bacterium]|nr:hypothetical protein [Alphaproteobacteria bacterium]
MNQGINERGQVVWAGDFKDPDAYEHSEFGQHREYALLVVAGPTERCCVAASVNFTKEQALLSLSLGERVRVSELPVREPTGRDLSGIHVHAASPNKHLYIACIVEKIARWHRGSPFEQMLLKLDDGRVRA